MLLQQKSDLQLEQESILRERLKPVATVSGFTAEIGASGAFCPNHVRLPVTTHFFSIPSDLNQITSPYTVSLYPEPRPWP